MGLHLVCNLDMWYCTVLRFNVYQSVALFLIELVIRSESEQSLSNRTLGMLLRMRPYKSDRIVDWMLGFA